MKRFGKFFWFNVYVASWLWGWKMGKATINTVVKVKEWWHGWW